MKKKKAIICGVRGQDGSYLSKFLIEKGYEVYGTSRNVKKSYFKNLERLDIIDKVNLESLNLENQNKVFEFIDKIKPDEIYNLSGQSSVSRSFDKPIETFRSIVFGTINILLAINKVKAIHSIRFYNATSSEMFGDTGENPAHENTRFNPKSPYGIAKAAAFWDVKNYRETYNIFCTNGILFNHESPMRPDQYVTRKIISAIYNIKRGAQKDLILGNINIQRDWGWAPEFVEAMWLILQNKNPEDFVIGTGQTNSLKQFCKVAFENEGLNYKDHVKIDRTLIRPSDIFFSQSLPEKAKSILNWEAKIKMDDLIKKLQYHQK